MNFFEIIGIITTSVIGIVLLILLVANTIIAAKELYIGIRVVVWLRSEFNEMKKEEPSLPGESVFHYVYYGIRFIVHNFGYFRSTIFTSKRGNVFGRH